MASTRQQMIIMLNLILFSLTTSAAGWVGESTIENYYVNGTGNLHICLTSGDIPVSIQSCIYPTYVFYSKSDSNFTEVFASVLAANASGSTMNFFLSGCRGGSLGSNKYPHGQGFTAS